MLVRAAQTFTEEAPFSLGLRDGAFGQLDINLDIPGKRELQLREFPISLVHGQVCEAFSDVEGLSPLWAVPP